MLNLALFVLLGPGVGCLRFIFLPGMAVMADG